MIVGLTGSIGMGKSTVAAMMRKAGVPVFDADAEVRRLQGPGGALLPAIEALFPGMTGPGGLDRVAMGRRVFGDRAALKRLESLVHPALNDIRRRFLRRHAARPIVVLDVPLLFEKRVQRRRLGATVTVSAAAWQQRRRVLARPGTTGAKLAAIRRIQMPDAQKRRLADFVIDTGGTLDKTRAQVRQLLTCLGAARGR